jgi:hypothetical protein
MTRYRDAYRKVWLDDLGGYKVLPAPGAAPLARSALALAPDETEGLAEVIAQAQEGQRLIEQLMQFVRDPRSDTKGLGAINAGLSDLDRRIEETGFHFSHLGPLTRMFVFAKENLSGTDPLGLASQMLSVYQSLERRGHKLNCALRG